MLRQDAALGAILRRSGEGVRLGKTNADANRLGNLPMKRRGFHPPDSVVCISPQHRHKDFSRLYQGRNPWHLLAKRWCIPTKVTVARRRGDARLARVTQLKSGK